MRLNTTVAGLAVLAALAGCASSPAGRSEPETASQAPVAVATVPSGSSLTMAGQDFVLPPLSAVPPGYNADGVQFTLVPSNKADPSASSSVALYNWVLTGAVVRSLFRQGPPGTVFVASWNATGRLAYRYSSICRGPDEVDVEYPYLDSEQDGIVADQGVVTGVCTAAQPMNPWDAATSLVVGIDQVGYNVVR